MNKRVVPKNVLKEKVGNGGFTEEIIAQAQKTIEENDVDFIPIGKTYLEQIRDALKCYEEDQNTKGLHTALLDPLMQLKAQGAMFHYSSISEVTDTVIILLDSYSTIDDTIIEIVRAYEKSANILFQKSISSDKDQMCLLLKAELETVCKKYQDKHL